MPQPPRVDTRPHAAAPGARRGVGASHAKAILFGEHAVVYGAPAIAIPVTSLSAEAVIERADHGLRLESSLFGGDLADAPKQLLPVTTAIRTALERAGLADTGALVRVRSSIPHERGLGSSAAVAAAISRAAFDLADAELDADTLFELIQTAERVAHGNPSGIDARTVAAHGAIRFNRGAVAPISIGTPLTLAFADSGQPGSTAEAVGSVHARRDREPEATDALLSRLADIAEGAIAHLASGDRDQIGAGMTEAHDILGNVGVSSPQLDALTGAARAAGALGAKLTGGGLGGCIIALADSPAHAEDLGAELRRAGAARTWTVEVPAA